MAKFEADITSYKSAVAFLDGSSERKIAPNTYVHSYPGQIEIVYYKTTIVIFFSDGRICLDHGEHTTATTKERINKCLPTGYKVFQKQGDWYLKSPDHTDIFLRGITIQA